MGNPKLRLILTCALTAAVLSGCGEFKSQPFDLDSAAIDSGLSEGTGPIANEPISPTPVKPFEPEPLLWDAKPGGTSWSDFLFETITSDPKAKTLINGAADVEEFCPAYIAISTEQKVNFWSFLISAIAKYESGFNPVSRFKESTMGTDPITGLQVYSEGLLQLSYQDITGWAFCAFDWIADQKFPVDDPRRTILDPYKNLSCGTKILAQQVQKRGRITLTTGVYWAVLKVGGKYTKINEIKALTRTLPFCKKNQ